MIPINQCSDLLNTDPLSFLFYPTDKSTFFEDNKPYIDEPIDVIYFLFYDLEIVYIGMSVRPYRRISCHLSSRKKFNRVAFVESKTLLEIEQKLIYKHAPVHNGSGNPLGNVGEAEYHDHLLEARRVKRAAYLINRDKEAIRRKKEYIRREKQEKERKKQCKEQKGPLYEKTLQDIKRNAISAAAYKRTEERKYLKLVRETKKLQITYRALGYSKVQPYSPPSEDKQREIETGGKIGDLYKEEDSILGTIHCIKNAIADRLNSSEVKIQNYLKYHVKDYIEYNKKLLKVQKRLAKEKAK